MKLGIMQPYFLPYIGYWQLIDAVDSYVIYDDVNYIKGGWINRNRILVNGTVKYISLELQGASPNKLINEIDLVPSNKSRLKLLKTIDQSYKRAPLYEEVYPIMEKIFLYKETNLAKFIAHSLKVVCEYLHIDTKLYMSSEIEKNCDLKGQDKVINICTNLNATTYINAIGGRELYSFSDFKRSGIELLFLQTSPKIMYSQFADEFQPNLSILDLMMMLSPEAINQLMKEYVLIGESENV